MNTKIGIGKYLLWMILFFTSTIVIYIIAANSYSLYFGKDGGLVSTIIFTCFISGLIFSFLKKKGPANMLLNFLLGFGIAFSSYVLSYLVDTLLSFIIFQDNRGVFFLDISGQIVVSTFIFLFMPKWIKAYYMED